MKKLVTIFCFLTLIFVFSGCGGEREPDAEQVLQSQIKEMNEIVDKMEQGEAELSDFDLATVGFNEEMKALNLSSEEIEKLKKKYQAEIDRVKGRKDKVFMESLDGVPPLPK